MDNTRPKSPANGTVKSQDPSQLWDDKILDVDSLPAVENKSSRQLTPLQTAVARRLGDGTPHYKIARKLAKGDPKKAKAYRTLFRKWMAEDPLFQQAVAAASMAELRLATPQVGKALLDVATKRKRVDAIKLAMEATGFHNPRVQHDHTGDIKITIAMPRPAPVESGPGKGEEGQPEVVDADVVE